MATYSRRVLNANVCGGLQAGIALMPNTKALQTYSRSNLVRTANLFVWIAPVVFSSRHQAAQTARIVQCRFVMFLRRHNRKQHPGS